MHIRSLIEALITSLFNSSTISICSFTHRLKSIHAAEYAIAPLYGYRLHCGSSKPVIYSCNHAQKQTLYSWHVQFLCQYNPLMGHFPFFCRHKMMSTIRFSEIIVTLTKADLTDMRPWMTFYGSVRGFNAGHFLFSDEEKWIPMPHLHSVMHSVRFISFLR